jgi:magnesium chelatase subunit H
VYAANNPSESILAKRRGYGTLISYNVPPYGRAGLYLELANLRDLLSEYRTGEISGENRANLQNTIWPLCLRCGIEKDVPLYASEGDESSRVTDTELSFIIPNTIFDKWVGEVSTYLIELQSRLFSSGLHALGAEPTHEELISYLQAYFGDKLKVEECLKIIQTSERSTKSSTGAANDTPFLGFVQRFLKQFFASNSQKITKEESLSD